MTEQIQVQLKPSTGGDVFSIEIAPSTKVKALKQKIADKFQITISEVKLIGKGKVLKDHLPFSDFGLASTDVVNVILPVPQATQEEQKQQNLQGLGSAPSQGRGRANQPPQGLIDSSQAMRGRGRARGRGQPTNNAGAAKQDDFQVKLDPNTFTMMSKDPKIHELVNDPQKMQDLIKRNPMLQKMIAKDPSLAASLCNPDVMNDLLKPESIAEVNQELVQTMIKKQKQEAIRQGVDESKGPEAIYQVKKKKKKPVKKVEDDDEEEDSQATQEELIAKFTQQLEELKVMGFEDQEKNIKVLQKVQGDVPAAMEIFQKEQESVEK